MIIINLEFGIGENTLTTYKYGSKIYEEQVKNKLYFLNGNTVNMQECLFVFPNNITGVSSSFVQGLFNPIIDKIGYINFEKYVSVQSKSYELSNIILNYIW